jgi:long-chain acyl-CoA synthetase
MITGSAPISKEVMEFLRICFSCPIMEGYGQTECTCAATCTLEKEQNIGGQVGVPIVCSEICLVSVPEMNYCVDEIVNGKNVEKGEICFRGPNVFQGYWKNPEKTLEAIDENGWLHSGDIGTWLPNGNLKIIDRKKNIFKLAQGEYIAPEKIENVYIQSVKFPLIPFSLQ